MKMLTLVSALAVLMGTPRSYASWNTFRGGPQNAGVSPITLKNATAQMPPVIFSTHGVVWGSAVFDDQGNAYVGSADKNFYKIDREGKQVWSYRILDRSDALIDSAAALAPGGKVVVPGGDGFLHALDRMTGAVLWRFKAHHASDSSHQTGTIVNSFEGNVQVGPNGLIYAGSDNGYLYAVTAEGVEAWSHKTGMMVWSSPAFDPHGRWLVFGSLDHHLYLLDPNSGAQLDTFDAGAEIKSSPAVELATGAIFFGNSGKQLVRADVEQTRKGPRLKRTWTVEVGGEVYSSPAVFNGRVVFGSLDGRVTCASTDGKVLWTYLTHSPVASSPLISADGVVLVGAKNGKLYALDLATGERLWSYRTSESLLKSNLDASPALRDDGVIVDGAYSGAIHFVPAALCAKAPTAQCERGGHEDFPELGAPVGPNAATLRVVDRAGRLGMTPSGKLGLFEPLALKLVAMEGGHLIDRAAISASRLSVSIEPKTGLRVFVSSDGGTLNILPKAGFAPGTRYRIRVNGHYYLNSSWLADRFKWIGLRPFRGETTFETTSIESTERAFPRLWSIGSLYLQQPQALDTYTPAALDGQAFLASNFGYNAETGRFLILVHPALPASPAPMPLIEPSKSFILHGELHGESVRISGALSIAAMGGTIPFQEVSFSGQLDADGDFRDASFFTVASCRDLQGNGSSYQFPYSLVSLVCDYRLRLIGVGAFAGKSLPVASMSPLVLQSVDWSPVAYDSHVRVTLSNAEGAMPADHLLSVVRYNPATLAVTGYAVNRIEARCATSAAMCRSEIEMIKGEASPSGGDVLQIYVDQVPVYGAMGR